MGNVSNGILAVLLSIGSAVSNVAIATADAFSSMTEDFLDSQASDAEERFRRYFYSFPCEILYGGMLMNLWRRSYLVSGRI